MRHALPAKDLKKPISKFILRQSSYLIFIAFRNLLFLDRGLVIGADSRDFRAHSRVLCAALRRLLRADGRMMPTKKLPLFVYIPSGVSNILRKKNTERLKDRPLNQFLDFFEMVIANGEIEAGRHYLRHRCRVGRHPSGRRPPRNLASPRLLSRVSRSLQFFSTLIRNASEFGDTHPFARFHFVTKR